MISLITFKSTPAANGRGSKWFFLIFAIIGLGLTGLASYNIYKNITTPWHIVTGYVQTSEVISHTSSDRISFSPFITYNYSYLGRWYTGSYNTGVSSGDYGESQSIVNKYKTGTKIQVKVNPSNLQHSMIKQDFIFENYEWLFVLSFGAVFVVVPMVMHIFSRRKIA